MGNTMWDDGIRTIASIAETTDYAEGVRSASTDRFVELGGTVLLEESFPSDVTDFRSQLTKLIETGPDALLLAAQAEFSGGTLVKQVRELGYEGPIYGDVVVIGTTAPGGRGRPRDGRQGHHHGPGPEQHEGHRGHQQLPGQVRLRDAAVVPGLRV